MSAFLALLRSDVRSHYPDLAPRVAALRAVANISIWAAALFRIAGRNGAVGKVGRWWLMSWLGCDVGPGATFGAGFRLPHPTGIVVGRGGAVGDRVVVYQNVTLGSDRLGRYPTLADDVVVYPGAVCVGDIALADRTVVGANCFLSRSTSIGEIVSGGRS